MEVEVEEMIEKVERDDEEVEEKEEEELKRRAGASNGQRYPLPCCTHFGNLKCEQQGKRYC